jgi:hypothetical protein
VIIGTIFLFICYLRVRSGHFTAEKHIGFEAAAWYWHFVDVVWLFLFAAVYIWGQAVVDRLTRQWGALPPASADAPPGGIWGKMKGRCPHQPCNRPPGEAGVCFGGT